MKKEKKNKILVTGCAGFIGMHVCKSLLEDGLQVFGIDNMNSYYEKSLKLKRLEVLQKSKNFFFTKNDISDFSNLEALFKKFKPAIVVNLAAQAGVRYSLINPQEYINSNVNGFLNILECCRTYGVQGLVYASSSSVYGGNTKTPFSEDDNVDNPVSVYAATKRSNEMLAKTYNHLYGLKSTGLRFFTVYGPWGRPDMSYYIFTKKILNNEQIKVFNYGNMKRDFTYIDDIVFGIRKSISNNYNYEIINLGNNQPENLLDMISIIEKLVGKKARKKLEPMQLGDVVKTYANINKAKELLSFNPKVRLREGLNNFINWYFSENIKS
jgi:UDP-glucuronate 4-epimerase